MSVRVLMISEHASPLATLGGTDSGGQNLYVAQLAQCLASRGYEVDVLTRRDSSILPAVVEWTNGVRVIHVPAGPPVPIAKEDLLGHMPEFTDYALRICSRRGKGYDLVHANFWMSGLTAAEIKRALGTPFVVTFHALGRVRRLHQGDADRFPDDRFAVEDRIVSEANCIVAECPQDEEDLIGLYHADPARIVTIPCGFDPLELWPVDKTLARVALGLPTETPIVLHVGRLVPRKGVDNVIRGIARLKASHGIEALLLIVGGNSADPDPGATPELGRLDRIARDEGIEGQVIFAGRRGRDALKYYYSAADLFATTPWYEPFGITPVESMACGTPVVGSSVGGIKFTVRPGETGFLVPPNNPERLAECFADALRQPGVIESLRGQALRRANDYFTWQHVATTTASLYEEIVAARTPAWSETGDTAEIGNEVLPC
jgi:glycosyltransferase involved in cell wall biosynthesis